MMKTPGVYVVEKNAFPNSVVEVATAVPAFIGHTESALQENHSLTNIPFKINSLAEYERYFGGAPTPLFEIVTKNVTGPLTFTGNIGQSSDYIAKQTVTKKTIQDATDAYNATQTNTDETKKLDLSKSYKEAYVKAVGAANESLTTINNYIKGITTIKSDFTTPKEVTDAITKLGDTVKVEFTDDIKIDDLRSATENLFSLITKIESVSAPFALKYNEKKTLYYNLKLFFANGGGSCYIVSIGSYNDSLDKDLFINAIDTLLKEQEPTIVVVPEAVNLDVEGCYAVQNAVANHCGKNQNRVTIMNVYDGYKDRKDSSGDVVQTFREKTTTPFLNYAAAYYPWLNTAIVSEKEISFENIDPKSTPLLVSILDLSMSPLSSYTANIGKDLDTTNLQTIKKVLLNQHPVYVSIVKEMIRQINLLPPAAALAGIYTLVDNSKEVWKAPANIGLAQVISPAVNVSHQEQEDLNVPLDGKSVNAIRYFIGEGIKVWGARTLDGNSLDNRYVNVRRTLIMLEESIKNAAKAFVFEANTTNTWVSIRSMINNFLNGIWKRGGLAGATPEDAFSVHIGLGDTMTPEDILEGIMRITVLVAVVRPAEFIEITFQQQAQKS